MFLCESKGTTYLVFTLKYINLRLCKLQNCNVTRQFVLFRANAFQVLTSKKNSASKNLKSYEFELKHHTFRQTENQKFSYMNILELFLATFHNFHDLFKEIFKPPVDLYWDELFVTAAGCYFFKKIFILK